MIKFRIPFYILSYLISLACVAGEKTVFTWPKSNEFVDNFSTTVESPLFWAPLGLFAILQVENWDHHLQKVIHRERALFGRSDRAGDFSDRGRSALNVLMVGSSLPLAWHQQKSEQFLFVMLSDFLVQIGVTYSRKSISSVYHRSRPHGDGDDSMPSGHATSASARSSLATLNMQAWPWQGGGNEGLQALSWTLAYTVAYARVEQGAHYPGDVLVGLSWGYFWSHMIKRNFYSPTSFWPELSWTPENKYLNLSMSF